MTRLTVFSLLLVGSSAMAASDMPGMDHSQMAGMDHSAMQSMDDGMMQPAAPTESRTPIPPLTDADRAAVFTSPGGHRVHDNAINTYFLADKLEWQDADDGSALAWDLSGWIGGDIDRLWLRSEGERSNGKTEDAEIQALWGHAISPWWDVVSGVRQDFKPGAPQTWAAFGLQGMALYNFEAEATAFIGEGGQSALRFEGDYDILLTNRLILQPTAELNVYGKNDAQRGIGSGLANTEAGLRLRYEIRRESAPYIAVTGNRTCDHTAAYARAECDDLSRPPIVIGRQIWICCP
ncbi:copper resistance protein B [Pseudomonas fluorescens]|uniref:Copper resistance protein B n=1 Tax=Pseudomonas fluorescens TaxID=294 RepID=A0A5E6X1K3_PSEFL|nr:copper resistance protein B [Pseudomonas fluorescens]VVN34614.1 Copper resistance protein B [Pseudomonas fluorescens]